MKNKLQLSTSRVMAHRHVTTKDLADGQGLSYNTVLSYRRGGASKLSTDALEAIANGLNVEVWDLFYNGEFSRPLAKIAQAAGVDCPTPATSDEIKALLLDLSAKLKAGVTEADFEPLDPKDNWI